VRRFNSLRLRSSQGQTDGRVSYTNCPDSCRGAALGVTSVRPAGASSRRLFHRPARGSLLKESRVRRFVTISCVSPTMSNLPFVVAAPEPTVATARGHTRQFRYAAFIRTVRHDRDEFRRANSADRNNSIVTKIGRLRGPACAAVTTVPACRQSWLAETVDVKRLQPCTRFDSPRPGIPRRQAGGEGESKPRAGIRVRNAWRHFCFLISDF
jgi:hypothetical protein